MKFRDRKEYRTKRHQRIRMRIRGTMDRPRMAIMLSNRNFYVQFIDDDKGHTLVSVSTLGSEVKKTKDAAKAFGAKAADAAKGKGIKTVVVDRGGFKFHGCLKAIVEGLTSGGISTGPREDK
jgi:large subunit ribosomal protein L18